MTTYSYHIQHDTKGIEPHWPNGWWSVYAITGDQIADRIRRDETGKITERHSWCGYLGMAETRAGILELIDAHEREQEEFEKRRERWDGTASHARVLNAKV